MWSIFGRYFFNGLVTLLPLFITIYMLWFLFSFADGIFGGIIGLVLGHPVPGIGFLLTIALTLFVGYLVTYIIGEKMIRFAEKMLIRIPVVKSIYSSVKQVNDVLFQQKGETSMRRACLVEYPRKGIWSVGFLTAKAAQEIDQKTGEQMVNVFIPNTPTPGTGFLIVVPEHEVKVLDMKIDDAFKYIVSAGVLQPKK